MPPKRASPRPQSKCKVCCNQLKPWLYPLLFGLSVSAFLVGVTYTLLATILQGLGMLVMYLVMPSFMRMVYPSRLGQLHVKFLTLYRNCFGREEGHSRSIRVDLEHSLADRGAHSAADGPSNGDSSRPYCVHTIACLADNYAYIIVDRGGPEGRPAAVALVDPCEPGAVIRALQRLEADEYRHGLQPVAILTTHHHWDHAGGNVALAKRFPGITVYGGQADRVAGCTKKLADRDQLMVGGLAVRALHTPSHTCGSLCFYIGGTTPALFSGDTLFCGGCGAPFEGSQEQMSLSFVKIWLSCQPNTLVFPGHEYTSAILPGYLSGQTPLPDHPAAFGKACSLLWRAQQQRNLVSPIPTVPVVLADELVLNSNFGALRRAATVLSGAYHQYAAFCAHASSLSAPSPLSSAPSSLSAPPSLPSQQIVSEARQELGRLQDQLIRRDGLSARHDASGRIEELPVDELPPQLPMGDDDGSLDASSMMCAPCSDHSTSSALASAARSRGSSAAASPRAVHSAGPPPASDVASSSSTRPLPPPSVQSGLPPSLPHLSAPTAHGAGPRSSSSAAASSCSGIDLSEAFLPKPNGSMPVQPPPSAPPSPPSAPSCSPPPSSSSSSSSNDMSRQSMELSGGAVGEGTRLSLDIGLRSSSAGPPSLLAPAPEAEEIDEMSLVTGDGGAPTEEVASGGHRRAGRRNAGRDANQLAAGKLGYWNTSGVAVVANYELFLLQEALGRDDIEAARKALERMRAAGVVPYSSSGEGAPVGARVAHAEVPRYSPLGSGLDFPVVTTDEVHEAFELLTDMSSGQVHGAVLRRAVTSALLLRRPLVPSEADDLFKTVGVDASGLVSEARFSALLSVLPPMPPPPKPPSCYERCRCCRPFDRLFRGRGSRGEKKARNGKFPTLGSKPRRLES